MHLFKIITLIEKGKLHSLCFNLGQCRQTHLRGWAHWGWEWAKLGWAAGGLARKQTVAGGLQTGWPTGEIALPTSHDLLLIAGMHLHIENLHLEDALSFPRSKYPVPACAYE